MRRAFVVILVVVFALPFAPLNPAQALSPDLVISQVYAGGGESGSTYQNDFVELFNRGRADVSLNGKLLHYVTANGQSTFAFSFTGAPTLVPGQHVLVKGSGNPAYGAPLQADQYAGFPMEKGGGKVVLGDLADPIDTVGWGSPNPGYEGTPAPALTTTTVAVRTSGGCAETDDNGADFVITTPFPRNATAWPAPCPLDLPAVVGTSPANGDSDVARGADLTVTFSEPVDVAAGWFALICSASGTVPATFSGGPTTFTIDPGVLKYGDFCRLTVRADHVTDKDLDDPPDAMAADHKVVFVTVLAPAADLAPRVVGSSPANGDSNVARGADLTVTFSEPVNVASGWFTLNCSSGGTVPTTFSGGPTIFTLDPAELNHDDFCRLTLLADKVTDTDLDDPPDAMADKYVAAFLTTPAPSVPPVVPTPPQTPTAVADQQQTLAWQPPAKLNKRGVTVLVPEDLRSDAGIMVSSTVKGKAKKGKTRYFKLLKGNAGQLSVRTYGAKGWWLAINQSATGSGYLPFSQRIFYVDGKRV